MYVAVIFELKVVTYLQECSGEGGGGRCERTFLLSTNLLVFVKQFLYLGSQNINFLEIKYSCTSRSHYYMRHAIKGTKILFFEVPPHPHLLHCFTVEVSEFTNK